jgi:hypothetical protein
MDKERMKQIERWAEYVRTSNGEWKKIHSKFINAQFQKANAFYKRLAKQPNGREKIIKLLGLKNPHIIAKLTS